MREQDLYLNKLQVMILMYAIQKKREKEPLIDGVVSNFEKYVIKRAYEIESYSAIKRKVISTTNKYIIPKSMIEYLINLTDVDILDPKVLDKYTCFLLGKRIKKDSKKIYIKKKH